MISSAKPTRAELLAAKNKTVRDVIAPGLRVLFCGINPGLYTAAVGHHFARPGNRFWPALFRSGFTDRLVSPFEERQLLQSGLGISNVVPHATASAAEADSASRNIDSAVIIRSRLISKVLSSVRYDGSLV